MRESIEIRGAAVNNLKHLNVDIPKEQLVLLAGVSGSGKSTLAFDTIAAEAGRQWQATYPLFLRNRLPRYERPAVESIQNLTPCVVVDQRPIGANARSTVGTASDVAPLVRLLFSRVGKPSASGSMAYSFNHPHGMCPDCTGLGEKVELDEAKMFDMDKSINEGAIRFRQFSGGSGLNPKALASKINGYNISDYFACQVSDLPPVLEAIDDPLGLSIAGQIAEYLRHMVQVGLGYLSLSRRTDTLSGGEAQRLKMVWHLGSSLSNITYIFDEPTAGLHPSDAHRIGELLLDLRDRHNTVLVVEHSRQMLELADHVIELGPLAGSQGGEIVYQGNLEGLKTAGTLTASAMREKPVPNPAPKPWTEGYAIEHARLHNLKDVSVTIPKGILTAVTGVAGSGKSSLICGEFVARHPEALVINQKPIGVSSRSTPATYTGVMDEIRKLFARENGVGVQWFSFNSKGACPVCKGKGEIMPDVAFADPVTIRCEECGGRRYNRTALGYTYQGKNIEEVMSLTIDQALEWFTEPKIRRPLSALQEVGLGYMTLGQPTSTLSGGETQRLKLASELQKSGNIYILDEPTTGLHSRDVARLLDLLRRLVDQGNTVVVVEHRPELIAAADWVIDMGPGGGNRGGEVLFAGTPEALADCERSETGRYLCCRGYRGGKTV